MSPNPELVPVRHLVVATSGAALVALALLVTVVLPVEYGRDPLGAGRILGLVRTEGPGTGEGPSGAGLPEPLVRGPAMFAGEPFLTDATTLTLEPYQYVEYKYEVPSGASFVYDWHATAALKVDFHGAPAETAARPSTEVSYDTRTAARGTGALQAPFAGLHGWFWENPGDSPVTIEVRSAGFYRAALELRPNRVRRTHALSPAASRAAGPEVQ